MHLLIMQYFEYFYWLELSVRFNFIENAFLFYKLPGLSFLVSPGADHEVRAQGRALREGPGEL